MNPRSRRARFGALVVLPLLILIILSPLAVPASITSSPPSSNDLESLEAQIRSTASTLDTAKAVALASQSSGFQAMSHGLGFVYNSIFNTWSYSFNLDGSVALTWKDVNVVYSLHSSNGSTTNLVVKEDPGPGTVTSVTVQRDVAQFGQSSPSTSGSSLAQQPLFAPLSPIETGIQNSLQSSQPLTVCGATSYQCNPNPPTTLGAASLAAAPTSTPDFTITASQVQMSFTAGGSSTSTITLSSINGFVGSIALVAAISPSSGQVPSIPLNVSSITLTSAASGSSTLSVGSSASTPAGSYTVTVTATSGTLVHAVTVTVNVQADIQLSSSPPSPSSFVAGNSATSTINLYSLGLSGSVSLSASVSPSATNGPTTSLNPSTVSLTPGSSASSTLSIFTSTSTPSNTYTVSVIATGPGVTRSVSVTVNVLPDFQISASSPPNLAAGTSGTSTISLNSLGLSGSVSLSANSPSGISTSFGPNPVSLTPGSSGSSTMTVSVVSSVPSNSYTITVTGTSGSLSHSASVTVNVCDRGQTSSSTFAGYTFREACPYFGSPTVYEARAFWNVPSVSEPASYFCFNAHCDLTVAVGLQHMDGGSDGYQVVAGTDSGLSCGIFGCGWSYYALYDLYPSSAVKCSISVSPGNNVYTSVDFVNGAYNIFIDNNSNGQVCSANGQTTAMGTPYFGVFGGFRPSIGGGTARLPQFGTVTMTSCYLGQGLQYQCLAQYNQGYSGLWLMFNGGNQNISVSSVASDDSFSFTWLTSNGT